MSSISTYRSSPGSTGGCGSEVGPSASVVSDVDSAAREMRATRYVSPGSIDPVSTSRLYFHDVPVVLVANVSVEQTQEFI